MADLNSLPQQFNSLIINLIKSIIDRDVKIYKIIVIDRNVLHSEYESLIKAILNGVEDTFCAPQYICGMQQKMG